MGMPADLAVHTNDRKLEDTVSKLDVAYVRTITDETAGVATGT